MENKVPVMLDRISEESLESLKAMAKGLVESLARYGTYEDDLDHYIFEEVMMMCYGKDYFKWHNSVIN